MCVYYLFKRDGGVGGWGVEERLIGPSYWNHSKESGNRLSIERQFPKRNQQPLFGHWQISSHQIPHSSMSAANIHYKKEREKERNEKKRKEAKPSQAKPSQAGREANVKKYFREKVTLFPGAEERQWRYYRYKQLNCFFGDALHIGRNSATNKLLWKNSNPLCSAPIISIGPLLLSLL